MNIFQSIFLGLLQGATEFLPISSSAHLYIAKNLLNLEEIGSAFDAATHLGTLIASFIVFWPEIKDVLKENNLKKGKFFNSGLFTVILTSIPVIAIGYFVEKYLAEIKSPIVTGLSLILIGVLFLTLKGKDSKNNEEVTKEKFVLPGLFNSFLIAMSQAFAFIPGVSRSGITILTARNLGLDFKKALRTSFILGIPVVAAAGGWGLITEVQIMSSSSNLITFILSIFVSGVSGFIAGSFLKNTLHKTGLSPFGIYRIIVGVIVIFIGIS